MSRRELVGPRAAWAGSAQVKCPRCRYIVTNGIEELRVVAPKLLPHPMRQADAVPRWLLAQAGPLAEFDDRRVGWLQPSETVRVGPQCRSQHPPVAPVVLPARWREAIPEAVELLRIDRVDGEVVLQLAT